MKKLFFFFAAFFALNSLSAQSFFLPSDTNKYYEEATITTEKHYPTMEEYYDSIVRIIDSVNSQMIGSSAANQVSRAEYETVDSLGCSLQDVPILPLEDTITFTIKPGRGLLNFINKTDEIRKTTPGREKIFLFSSPYTDTTNYSIFVSAQMLVDLYVHELPAGSVGNNILPTNHWQYLGSIHEGASAPFRVVEGKTYAIVVDNIFQGGNVVSLTLQQHDLPIFAEYEKFRDLDRAETEVNMNNSVSKVRVEKSNKEIISEFDETTSSIIVAEDVKNQTKTTNQIPTSFDQVKRKQTNEAVTSFVSAGIINDIPPVNTEEALITEVPSIFTLQKDTNGNKQPTSLQKSEVDLKGWCVIAIVGAIALAIILFLFLRNEKEKEKKRNGNMYSLAFMVLAVMPNFKILAVLFFTPILIYGLIQLFKRKKRKNNNEEKNNEENYNSFDPTHNYDGVPEDYI